MRFSKNSMKYKMMLVTLTIKGEQKEMQRTQSLQKRSSQVFPCCGKSLSKCLQEKNSKNKLKKVDRILIY